MQKFDRKALERNNLDEFKRIAVWLSQGPKVVIQASVTAALSQVMRDSNLGGEMWHDSSNAAYNWRIRSGSSGQGSYKDYKGQAPVGSFQSYRSLNGDVGAIAGMISQRLVEDAQRLDRTVWANNQNKPVSVSIVNPIYGQYAVNANLSEAARSWDTEAESAAQKAFDAWMSGGPTINWARHNTFGG